MDELAGTARQAAGMRLVVACVSESLRASRIQYNRKQTRHILHSVRFFIIAFRLYL
jgi:hypothetical protein